MQRSSADAQAARVHFRYSSTWGSSMGGSHPNRMVNCIDAASSG